MDSLIDITKQRKVAALKPDVELQPHQQRVVSRLEKEPAVLAYHGLGSGKTLASIAAGEQIGGEKTIVVPAALRENYAKELNKFVGKDPTGYNIVSYTKATRPGGMPPAGLTVFDEAHRMGREGTQASKLVAKAPGKVLMLTGTPVRNDPVEFVPLLRALGQGRDPPETHRAFRDKFVEQVQVDPGWWERTWYGTKPGIVERIKNRRQLAALIAGRVDYHPAEGEYPRVTEENIEVEMTPRQTELYNAFLDENQGLARKVRNNLPPNKSESQRLNAFLSAVRQLSNNPQSFDMSLVGSPVQHSPKMRRMLSEIHKGIKTDKNFKAVVYSNYLDSGIMPLFNALQARGVPAQVFSGGLSDSKRREIIADYNTGKTKVLLVSGAGSEGLDLKGTKLMQLMEPHWNEARLDQVTGRAIRHKSHSHLPESEREVKVQHFYSHPPRTWAQRQGFGTPETGADQYMANLSARKQALIDDFLKILQQSSYENKAASLVDIVKRSADFAPGLPDPRRFGRPADVTTGAELPYVVQRHRAERAGPHYDVRFGVQPSPSAPLLSFATKKEMPGPGGKIMLFQQPLHKGQYASFEGELERGYGKGTVKTHDKGGIIVTKAQSDQVNFMVTHKRFPEFYTLKRIGGPAGKETARQRATQGGTWLLINTTPMDAAKLLGGKPEQVGLNKLKYTSVPADKVEKLFSPDYRVQAKLDGASALYHLLSDRIEALSYRVSKEGRPIIHTYRIFGPGGARLGRSIPKDLEGTILRGEIFGMREGKAIPSQELGGLLNASVANSLRQQQERKVDLRNMVFDVVRLGKNPVGPMGAEERLAKLTEISKYLPKNKFMLPETAQTPEQARELYQRIVSGEHPLTREGIVGWPIEPGKKPIKVKPRPESDVWVRNIFPGEKGLEGVGAGGFEYSLSPEGPIVGRVGTGFTQQTREEMLKDPESWVGRLARISSLEKFPSGAHRAPSFTALHEDYPMKKVGATTAAVAPVFKSKFDRYAPALVGVGVGGSGLLIHHLLMNKVEETDKAQKALKRRETAQLIKDLGADKVVQILLSRKQFRELSKNEEFEGIARGAYFHPEGLRVPGALKELRQFDPNFTTKAFRQAKRHGLIIAPRETEPATLAHELGHATGDQRPLGHGLGDAATPLASIGAGLAGLYFSHKPWSVWKKILATGGTGTGLGLVANLPSLTEEARASFRAYDALKNLGLSDVELGKVRQNLGAAYGTYFTDAALTPASIGLAGPATVGLA